MRVAICTGVLRVPPTYFVAQHATFLSGRAQFAFFARSADVAHPLPGPLNVPPGTSPPRGLRLLLAFLSAPVVAVSIYRFHPDVIHQHFSTWAGPALWAARASGSPLLVTLHGYDVLPEKPKGLAQRALDAWHRRGLRQLVSHGAQFLAVSDFLRNEAIRAGVSPQLIVTLPLGVDAGLFSPGDRNATTALAGRKVVFVGRLARQKGGEDLIRAMSRVAQPHSLEFIGDGPEQRVWQALSHSLGVNVTFTGRIPQSEVCTRLRGAALLVMPSPNERGRREAAGLTLLEAQACGVPVVAYASGGMPDMLIDGRTGRLVPEGDIDQLAHSIDEILNLSEVEYLELSSAARRHVELSGDSRSAAGSLFTLYEDAIRRRSSNIDLQ